MRESSGGYTFKATRQTIIPGIMKNIFSSGSPLPVEETE